MEKISFREIFYESLELLKADKKRFGTLLAVMVVLGFLSDIFKGKAISSLISMGSIAIFVFMSISTIIISQKFIEKNYIIDTDTMMKRLNAELGKSFLLILFEGAIILAAFLVMLMPLAIILTAVGSNLEQSPSFIVYFAVILFSIPLMIVNIMISYSLQYLLIKKSKVVESVQNSYYLVKNQFKKAMIIGLKINLFYYLVVILFFKVPLLGALTTNALGIVYTIMNTFVFYKLIEENTYEI